MLDKMATMTVSEKGEITIPIQIRKLLNLKPGQKMIGIVKNKAIFLKRIDEDKIKEIKRLEP